MQKLLLPAVFATIILDLSGTWANAQEVPVLDLNIPNYVGAGIGFTPDYLGSDDAFFGGLPLARYTFTGSERYVSLVGTYADLNLLDDPVFKLGPTVQYRFGREDVKDDVVEELPSINSTIEAGIFAAAEFADQDDPRKRLRVGGRWQHDVLGEHDGWLASAAVTGWYPIAGLFEGGLSLGTTYGSSSYMGTFFDVSAADAARTGLQTFDADAGFRDVNATLVALVPISKHWILGAGLMYQRLLGNAADSPIVNDRGSADQLSGGIGVAYAW